MHYGMCSECLPATPPPLPSLSSLLTLRFKMLLVGWGRSALRANALLLAAFPASRLAELKEEDGDEAEADERAAIMALVILVQLY